MTKSNKITRSAKDEPSGEPQHFLTVWQRDDGQWEWVYDGADGKHGNHYDPCGSKADAVEEMRSFIRDGGPS